MRTKNAMQLKAIIRNRAEAEGVPTQLVMQNYLLEGHDRRLCPRGVAVSA